MTDKFPGTQVIQYLDNNKVRVFEVKDWHDPDDNITTVELTGNYKDVNMGVN